MQRTPGLLDFGDYPSGESGTEIREEWHPEVAEQLCCSLLAPGEQAPCPWTLARKNGLSTKSISRARFCQPMRTLHLVQRGQVRIERKPCHESVPAFPRRLATFLRMQRVSFGHLEAFPQISLGKS